MNVVNRIVSILLVPCLLGNPALAFYNLPPRILTKQPFLQKQSFDQQALANLPRWTPVFPWLTPQGHHDLFTRSPQWSEISLRSRSALGPGANAVIADWHKRYVSWLLNKSEVAEEAWIHSARNCFIALRSDYLSSLSRHSTMHKLVRKFPSIASLETEFIQHFPHWLIGGDLPEDVGYLLNYAARLRMRQTSLKINSYQQEELLNRIRMHIKRLGGSFGRLKATPYGIHYLPVKFKIDQQEILLDIEIHDHHHLANSKQVLIYGNNLPLNHAHFSIVLQERIFHMIPDQDHRAAWEKTLNHEILEALRRALGDSLDEAHDFARFFQESEPRFLSEEIRMMKFSEQNTFTPVLGADSHTSTLWSDFWSHSRSDWSPYRGKIAEFWEDALVRMERLGRLSSVLDIGTGNFSIAKIVQQTLPQAQVHAIDIAQLPADRIPPGISFEVQSAERTTFPKNSMDLIVSMHGLEYSHLDQSIPEIHRILRPGGHGIFVFHTPGDRDLRIMSRILDQEAVLRTLDLFNRLQGLLVVAPKGFGDDYLEPVLADLRQEINQQTQEGSRPDYLRHLLLNITDFVQYSYSLEAAMGELAAIRKLHEIRVFRASELRRVTNLLPDPASIRLLLEKSGFDVESLELLKDKDGHEIGMAARIYKPLEPSIHLSHPGNPEFLRHSA
jgi:ubiquinone/menaquinone biosynthesis C-methylase UbiE